MKQLKKLTMTLALLIMAVGGAWAQSSPNVVEFAVPADWEGVESNITAGDLPGFKAVTEDEVNAWTGAPTEGFAVLFYAFDGEGNAYYVSFDNGAPLSAHSPFEKYLIFGYSKSNVKIYYTAEPEITEWSLTPDETGKKWTLAKMPASDVELQVEYFAESNLFLSKDALADKANIAVKAGELGVQFGNDGKSANTITEGTPMTVTYNGTKKVIGFKVEKKGGAVENAYLKWDADQKKLVATEIPAEVKTVADANADVEWSAGTYVVEGQVTINGSITLNGNVELIIKDGAKLTVNSFFNGDSHKLSIYGQANQTGQLVVNCSYDDAIKNINTLEVHSCQVTATSSDTGCCGFYFIQTFNVYGGSVDAEGTGTNGYGIVLAYNGLMNIYGGDVKAVGKDSNGITTVDASVTVTVYGGKLWAECADNQAIYDVNLQKGEGFTGKIEYSSDKSTWSETVDANAKYVRAGY